MARFPRLEGVRGNRWKYCSFIETEPHYEELYDLENDSEEEHNLASSPEHGPRLEHMRERHAAWKSNLEAWTPGERWSEPKPSRDRKEAV